MRRTSKNFIGTAYSLQALNEIREDFLAYKRKGRNGMQRHNQRLVVMPRGSKRKLLWYWTPDRPYFSGTSPMDGATHYDLYVYNRT